MSNLDPQDNEGELPPPGNRWGAGAQSVLPYLTKSLQAKPFSGAEPRESRPREGNPVFTSRPGDLVTLKPGRA